MKEEINDLKDDYGQMKNQISSLNSKVEKAIEDTGRLNKFIEKIIFRDLIKKNA